MGIFLATFSLVILTIIGLGLAVAYYRSQYKNQKAYSDSLYTENRGLEKLRDQLLCDNTKVRSELNAAKVILKDFAEDEHHAGDLSAEEEAILVARVDEVTSQNDALLDEIDSLKK